MVQVTDTLQAKPREGHKKGAARKLRASGWVPSVAYRPGGKTRHLALDPKAFVLQRQAFGRSHIYEVAVAGGDRFKALIKDIHRDAVTRVLLHVDLYEVDMHKPIRVNVPIELTGKAKGLIEGGLLTQLLRSVEVQCLPGEVPAKLVVDVTALGLGATLHLADVELPAGVKLMAHGADPVAAVVAPDTAAAATEEAPAAPGAAAAAPGAAKAPEKK